MLATIAALTITQRAEGFGLLGPYAAWMNPSNGYQSPGDIGGPMDINEGYRWNVPVVTYGFHSSFLNFFGSNGVAAVEAAIQILNSLPPASSIVLTNFPEIATRVNFRAEAESFYDLKSLTLMVLLEHMGLAQPTRYVFALRQWSPTFVTNACELSWPGWVIPDYIIRRNFDPLSLCPTSYVNDIAYSGCVDTWPAISFVETFVQDPNSPASTAVADDSILNFQPGKIFTGLTRDDVGGLRYLLGTNNVRYETLLSDVHGIGGNITNYINGAWRPGIEKISFVPQPVMGTPGQWAPLTNQYTDTYVTNGVLLHQQLERIVAEPDFLFRATNSPEQASWLMLTRSGTTNWINNAASNGSTNTSGPGVIPPPVLVDFRPVSIRVEVSDYGFGRIFRWSSFDSSTNDPICYPSDSNRTNELKIFFELQLPNGVIAVPGSPSWHLPLDIGATFSLETSTDLSSWTNLGTLLNTGARIDCLFTPIPRAQQFFRIRYNSKGPSGLLKTFFYFSASQWNRTQRTDRLLLKTNNRSRWLLR